MSIINQVVAFKNKKSKEISDLIQQIADLKNQVELANKKSIDITKLMNDINAWLNDMPNHINKLKLWFKDLPNKVNRLIEKVKN